MAEMRENETETCTHRKLCSTEDCNYRQETKQHRKTIIPLYVYKNTSCDCVDRSTFSNDVLNSEVKLEHWAHKYMHVALLLVSET